MSQSDTAGQTALFVGVAEAARILRRPVRTVNRWGQTGKLPVALKMPGVTGALLFRREDVEALAESSKAAAA